MLPTTLTDCPPKLAFGPPTCSVGAASNVNDACRPGCASERVLGLDDKHLDFRIWLAVRDKPDGTEAWMSTLVRYNGVSGRIYLFLIMPFHKLLSRYMLGRALRLLRV